MRCRFVIIDKSVTYVMHEDHPITGKKFVQAGHNFGE